MSDQLAIITDFPNGLRNWKHGLLNPPTSCVVDGENVELYPALKTRPGYTQMSHATASGLPAGEIMAMRQVRFPTNETSYVVVQVAEGPMTVPTLDGTGQAPPFPGFAEGMPRVLHAVAYDSQRDRIWVHGGADDPNMSVKYSDLWYFDRATETWHEVTNAVNDPAVPIAGHSMIYDAANDRLVIWAVNLWRAYDIATNTYSELTTSGETVTGRYGCSLIYRSANQSAIITGGWSPPDIFRSLTDYYELDLTTLVVTLIEPLDGPGTWTDSSYHGVTYDSASDTMAVMSSGQNNPGEFWELDCTAGTWAQRETLAPGANRLICQHPLTYCSSRYYVLVADQEDVDHPYQLLFVFIDGAWVEGAIEPEISYREWTHPIIAETDLHLVLGVAINEGEETPISGVEIISNLCLYDPTQEAGLPPDPATRQSWLYACPDHLPTTTGVFQPLYALGAGAGVCSFAVLNDRLVLTEGIAAPPLVTGLSLSDDASDWLVPKAVLVSQDGINYYDVSPQVCDRDPDTIANIGNIRSSGALFVCCDMPQVEAVWFEMETPNTLSLTEGPRAYSATVDFTAAGDLNRQDLKGDIDHWVQDAGATGHFEDAGNTPLTLGAGNACPDVEEGLEVVLAGGSRYIVNITPDGEGSGEVELSATTTSQDVTAIYGMHLSNNQVSVKTWEGDLTTTWTGSAALPAVMASASSLRIPILASELSQSGNHIQVRFKTPYQQVTFWNTPTGSLLLGASHVSIVERDGSTANGTGTPTEITFNNGQSGFSCTTFDTAITSDLVPFILDETKDYLIIIDTLGQAITWSTGNTVIHGGFFAQLYPSGSGYRKIGTVDAPAQSWNQQMVTGFSDFNRCGLTNVSVTASFIQPTNLYVGTTTDDNHASVVIAEDFQAVTVTDTKPTGTTLWQAVSFDGRSSFSVFLNDAWRSIVQHESATTWQYKDGADAWQNASTNDLYTALREAFAITENQMTSPELEAITSAQWQSTGGVELHVTNYLDFAWGMAATADEFPYLTSFTVDYNDYGTTRIFGWKAGDWDAGDGWDDNTVVSDIPWAATGTIEYLGAAPFEADYSVLNEVPGYWFKFVPSGTSSDCAISRILYKAPCQPLANIGDGQPDVLMALIFENGTTGEIKDFGSYPSDSVTTEISQEEIGAMTDADYLYAGYILPFNAVSVLSYWAVNSNASVLSLEYWNGETYVPLTITDGTSAGGNTFGTVGKISWSLPDDWRANIPFDGFLSRGYWIRLSVSATLSAGTSLGELRVYSVPPALAKHNFVAVSQDRVFLAKRPDGPDQVDLSRTLEEYGFTGSDSGSYRVGGMDQITSMIEAWNGLLVGKTESLHLMIGDSSGFAFQSLEAARLTPVNSQVIIKAPAGIGDDGSRAALYFLNRYGAFVFSGMGSDQAFGSGRNMDLAGGAVNWWLDDATVFPRIDKRSLHRSCGEYWPVKNWLVWSVPMILEGTTEQTTNNRVIVFDLNLKGWLPPFTLALSALCLGYDYSSSAAGKNGPVRLYGGTYDGRVLELFSEAATTDGGTDIGAWIKTPWLQFDSPVQRTIIRNIWAWGTSDGDVNLTLYRDGNDTTAEAELTMTDLSGLATKFTTGFHHAPWQGRFFQVRLDWTGPADISVGAIVEDHGQDKGT